MIFNYDVLYLLITNKTTWNNRKVSVVELFNLLVSYWNILPVLKFCWCNIQMLTVDETLGMECQRAQDNWKWPLQTFHHPLHIGVEDNLDAGWQVCQEETANMGHVTHSFFVEKTVFTIRFTECFDYFLGYKQRQTALILQNILPGPSL
jgi:hypothetical protein